MLDTEIAKRSKYARIAAASFRNDLSFWDREDLAQEAWVRFLRDGVENDQYLVQRARWACMDFVRRNAPLTATQLRDGVEISVLSIDDDSTPPLICDETPLDFLEAVEGVDSYADAVSTHVQSREFLIKNKCRRIDFDIVLSFTFFTDEAYLFIYGLQTSEKVA